MAEYRKRNLKCCGNCKHENGENACDLNSRDAKLWEVCPDWEFDCYSDRRRLKFLRNRLEGNNGRK